MSLFIVGTCIGTRLKEQLNKQTGELKKTWLVGINVQKDGGFIGETETFSIKVNKDQEEAGLLQLYTKLNGKQLMVPVKAFPYSFDGTAGISYSLVGDGKPSLAPVAKAAEVPA